MPRDMNDIRVPGQEIQFPQSFTLGSFSNSFSEIYMDDYGIRYTESLGFQEIFPDNLNPLKEFWDWLTGGPNDPTTRGEARERAREEQAKADLWLSIMNSANSARQGESFQDGAYGAALAATAAAIKSALHAAEAQRLRELAETLPE